MMGLQATGLVRAVVAAVAVGAAVAVVGCGGDEDAKAFRPTPGSDSAYCDAYRAWQVHELDGGEGDEQRSPAALRKYWNEYVIFEETLLHEAPREIRQAVTVKVSGIRTLITPLLEKYDFDEQRLRREGTPAERALLAAPPAAVRTAQDAQHAYEARTCGTEPSPPAADVTFAARESSKPFCAALLAFDGELEKVATSKFDPQALRALVTGDRFTELLDGLDAAAPAELAADVDADTEWFRTRWSDVVTEYEYDIRNIYLLATPEDLAVFNRTHPDVLEHTSRTTAYEDQVCSG